MELAESRHNGALLADAVMRVKPSADEARVASSAFMIMHLGEAAIRIAVSLPPDEGRAIIEAYKGIADREIGAI